MQMSVKEDTPKVESEGNDMNVHSWREKIVGNKFLITVTLLVVTIIVLAGYVSDQRLDLKDRFLWRGEQLTGSNTLETDLENCRNELKMKDNCPDGSSVDSEKMMEVETQFGDYEISFEYPERFVNYGGEITNSAPGIGVEGESKLYTLLAELPYGEGEIANSIFMITDYKLRFSYFEEAFTQPDEFGRSELTINGKNYSVIQSMNGESVEGRSAYVTNYLVELEDDLYLSVLSSSETLETFCVGGEFVDPAICEGSDQCVYKDDCNNFEPEVVRDRSTPQEDIDDAFKIMESFKWEKK